LSRHTASYPPWQKLYVKSITYRQIRYYYTNVHDNHIFINNFNNNDDRMIQSTKYNLY